MLTNNARFSAAELIALFGRNNIYNIDDSWLCSGVSTDTRTIEHGNVFVALTGENSDGHQRIIEAFDKGASAAIVNNSWIESNGETAKSLPLISVDNTLTALGRLASLHRKKFNIPVIAVAGSNGKTTTKEFIAHVLSRKFNVLKTHENFNNQIGVPMMMFLIDESTGAAVLETGTNEPGEISILCSLLDPTHGLITNIGKEHLEKLIDLDGVELEETFLFGYLHKKSGTAFINMDDERLKKYDRVLERKLTFGSSADNMIQALTSLDEELHPSVEFHYNDNSIEAKLRTQGYTTALNAIAAASVGIYFDLSPEEIKDALESFENPPGHGYGRMVVEKTGSFTIINDCYNANPDSMKAALASLRQITSPGRKYAVLGDMRELGQSAHSEHLAILMEARLSADEIFITGEEMKKAFETLTDKLNINCFDNKQDLVSNLVPLLKTSDIILVKGSRGMRMEDVIEKLKEI